MDLRERIDETTQRHPWERARYEFFKRVLADADLLRAGRSILDVGSGDAWFARRLRADLAPAARLSCWDAEYRPEHLETLARWAPGIEFSTARPSHKVDLALLLDVLEHIEDDAAFLGDLARMNLEPGAHVLVSVPAYGSLFTSHDTFLGHHRRYTPSACASLLERNGFTILRSGGLFHSLLLPRVFTKMHELVRASVGRSVEPRSQADWAAPATVTAAVDAVLALDNAVSTYASKRRLFVPGLSFWALCRI